MRKTAFIISILVNIYLVITLLFNAPLGQSGGRVIQISDNTKAALFSTRDMLGLFRFHELRIIDGEGSVKEECLLKPRNVLPWYKLRERTDVLVFDEKSQDVIWKVSGFTVLKSIEGKVRQAPEEPEGTQK